MNELEHDWFSAQLATYLADGLSADERSRFQAHAAQCESCAHELEDARAVESNLHDLFADLQPAADFEDRMVGRFLAGKPKRRMRIHPLARRAALAAAAAVVVGAVGYLSERAIQNGGLISPQQIAASFGGIVDREMPAALSVPATRPAEDVARDNKVFIYKPSRSSAMDIEQAASVIYPSTGGNLRGTTSSPQSQTVRTPGGSHGEGSPARSGTGSVAVVADPSTDTVLVTTRPENWDQVRDVLDELDRGGVPQQVALRYTNALDASREINDLHRTGQMLFAGGGTVYGGVSHSSVRTIGDVSGQSYDSRTNTMIVTGNADLVQEIKKTIGTITYADAGVGTIKLGGAGTLAGNITVTNGISNTGGLTKTGAGPLAWTGSTTVRADMPSKNGEKWDFGGGGDVSQIWSDVTGTRVAENIGSSMQNPNADAGAGLAFNDKLDPNTPAGWIFKPGSNTASTDRAQASAGGNVQLGGALRVDGAESATHGTIKVVPVAGQLNTSDVTHISTGAPLTTNGILPAYIGQNGTYTQLGFASLSGGKGTSFGMGSVSGAVSTDSKDSSKEIGLGLDGQLTGGNRTLALNGAIGTNGTNGNTFVSGGSTGAIPGLTKAGSGTMVVGGGTTPVRQSLTVNGGTFTPADQFNKRGGGVLSVTGGTFNYSAGSLVSGAGGVAGVTPNTDIVQTGTVDFFKPAAVDDSSLRRQSSAANLPALGDVSGSANRLDPARASGRTEFSGAMTGARSYAINGASTFENSTAGPGSGAQNTHSVTQSFPATQPIGNTPIIGSIGSATPLVQAFIQQSTGPNPVAAIERTELALANTQQQPTQPRQGGAAVVGEAVQGQPQAQQPQTQQPQPAPQPAPVIVRRVIRDGVMEFEVDSFDSTFAVVAKITSEEGGFVVAADSDRLANGKVRGTITVRVPPDNLDTLILKLRALGDLKSQRLGSKDISKEYTDLESELRAGKAMEQRLLDMIKNAQGEVKDLLEAEKELANWRTKLEKIQGQMNYFNNLVAMATLTINAYEKDIRTPATATQSEEINTGIEAEDVDGARTAALKAIDEVKGRIIESSLQQMNAGQFAAKVIADVAPENAGQVVDRLRQIGKVARLDSQKKQTTGSGQTPPQGTSSPGVGPKVEQAPTRLIISIYNLANVAPRLTTNLNLAADDVEATYRAILARVNQAEGRVVSSKLDRQDANNVSGSIQFEVKTPDADPVLNDIRQPVQVLRLNVTENPDTANVTTTKQGFTVQIIPAAQVTPRLTTNLNLAAADVEATYASILNQVRTSGGRVITSNLNRQDATQAVGSIQFEIKSTEADALMNELRKTVQVLTLNVSENTGAANLTSLKQGFAMQIIPAAQVQPREVRALAVQTSTVDSAVQKSTAAALAAGGRVLESSMTQDENGAMIARIAYEVPLDKLESVSDVAKSQGKVRTAEASRNAQVPEGPLSRARINLTVGTGETIVPQSGGFWDTIRGGLSTSVKGLLWSLQLIIIGLCLIGPWVLMVWGGVKWMKRRKKAATATSVA